MLHAYNSNSYYFKIKRKEHAKLWFKELGELGDTSENLLHAAEGENAEWTDICTSAWRKRPRKRNFSSWRRSSAV